MRSLSAFRRGISSWLRRSLHPEAMQDIPGRPAAPGAAYVDCRRMQIVGDPAPEGPRLGIREGDSVVVIWLERGWPAYDRFLLTVDDARSLSEAIGVALGEMEDDRDGTDGGRDDLSA